MESEPLRPLAIESEEGYASSPGHALAETHDHSLRVRRAPWHLACCAGGGILAALAACTAVRTDHWQAIGYRPMRKDAEVETAPIASSKATHAARGLHADVSKPPERREVISLPDTGCPTWGVNCWAAKCCRDPGFQCFMKDLGWAECKASCHPGMQKDEVAIEQSPWACTPLSYSKPLVQSFSTTPETQPVQTTSTSPPTAANLQLVPFKPGSDGFCCWWPLRGQDLSEDEVCDKCVRKGGQKENCGEGMWCNGEDETLFFPPEPPAHGEKPELHEEPQATLLRPVRFLASDTWLNETAEHAFDGNPDTKWHSQQPKAWLQAVLAPGQYVVLYRMKFHQSEVAWSSRWPGNITVLGSNDEKAWTRLWSASLHWDGVDATSTRPYSSPPSLEAFRAFRFEFDNRYPDGSFLEGGRWHPADANKLSVHELMLLGTRGSPPALPKANAPEVSLYCFMLVRSGSYEVDLAKAQVKERAGIYRCDGFSFFSDSELQLSPENWTERISTELVDGSLTCTMGGKFNTALNSDIFVRVWQGVLRVDRWPSFDWTIKLDPDAVFLPERLHQHLANYAFVSQANQNDPVYLNNCKDGLHGPVEVFSQGAVRLLASGGLERCRAELQDIFASWGEDVFLRRCMRRLGAQRVDDFGILTEMHCDPYPKSVEPCISGKVAFHPLKDVSNFLSCFHTAEGKKT